MTTLADLQASMAKLSQAMVGVRAPAVDIAFINASTVVTADEMAAIAAALEVQLLRDFYPAWGVYAKLVLMAPGAPVPPSYWQLAMLDTSDVAGALGYHDITASGQPLGKIFAKTTIADGAKVSVTASHELLEMLVDPEINLSAQVSDTRLMAYEVGDPVEADNLGYDINGVTVSDFALPAWWGGTTGPFDHLGHCTKALEITAGGYMSVLDFTSASGWTQITADGKPGGQRAPIGSRRERRRVGRASWQRSQF
jgi:hypothetical protein